MASQIGRLLDLLPARGPTAFDNFCEALLESDHSYVAEYLKTHEGRAIEEQEAPLLLSSSPVTDTFRIEVEPLTSELMLDRLVSIFKKNTPTVQRFAERKFKLILEEQERDLLQKDAENRELSSRINVLSLDVVQLRNFLSSCTEISEDIRQEIERDFVSRTFLREEKKHLDNLRESLTDIEGFERMCLFFSNMKALLTFLEKYAGLQNKDEDEEGGDGGGSARRPAASAYARNLQSKMTAMTNMLVGLVDDFGTKANIEGPVLRKELEKVLRFTQGMMGDVSGIREVFKSTVKQKKALEGEVLSLLHATQEIRRLDRELGEKEAHVEELRKQAQVLKRKTKHHRKQLDQIQVNAEQRKAQMSELQESRQEQMKDVDLRLQRMLTLLPDLDDADYVRSDTELTSEESSVSRSNTPDHIPQCTGKAASLHNQMLKNLALKEDNCCKEGETSDKAVLLERRKAMQGTLRAGRGTIAQKTTDAEAEKSKAKNDDLREKLKRLVPSKETEKCRMQYSKNEARKSVAHEPTTLQSNNREGPRDVSRDLVCANITSLDAGEVGVARHSVKNFDLENWVPPKTRYAERESFRTNRVEITLSSQLPGK